MRKLIEKMKGLVRDEEGATMVEYAIMVAVIAIVAMVGAKVLGTNVNTTFDNVAKEVPGGTATP